MRPELILAYIDVGTGALAIQLLIGFGAAVALSVAVFWRRLTHRVASFVSRKKKKSAENF